MFECGSPTLVFITQTHHPVLEHHTGYLFGYYEFHFHKPRELFFTHIYEAQVFALYRGAKLEMNPDLKPGIVTAQEYTLAGQDESQFMHIPDYRTGRTAESYDTASGLKERKRRKQAALDFPTDAQLTEVDELLSAADTPPIDWFGGD